MAVKPLKVEIMVSRKDGVVPYDSLTEREKVDLGKRLNQRAIRAAVQANGLDVDFVDLPPKTVTA